MSRTEDWTRFLEKNLKDLEFRDVTNERIDQCVELIRNGLGLNEIQKQIGLGKKETGIIFELGHSRIDIKGKFEKWNRLWMDQYLSRYSTPEIVCRHRADRINGFNVIEAGSGAGMQSIFLSQTNTSALGIEILPERYLMARLNSELYKTKNLKFLHGDIYSLSPSFEIDQDTLIFSDPARPQTEGERSMESLIPSPLGLMKVFGDRTGNFVFDLPPQMKWDKISIKGEKEYLSIEGILNRLTLYTGRLRGDDVSAVLMPGGKRLSGNPKDETFPDEVKLQKYLAIPDVAIGYAKLLWLVRERFGVIPAWKDQRRYIYTTDHILEGFPGEQFEVISAAGIAEVPVTLKQARARKVYPKFPLGDQEYYELKHEWESDLEGDRDVFVFRKDNLYILSRKLV